MDPFELRMSVGTPNAFATICVLGTGGTSRLSKISQLGSALAKRFQNSHDVQDKGEEVVCLYWSK